MGLFVHVLGKLHCLRCHAEAEARIQTKLFKVGFWNSANDYCVGDTEEVELSRMNDYAPLYDWGSTDNLVVVMGEWTCSYCSLSWQFAKVILGISYSETGCMLGSIKSISTFAPIQLQDFAGVHRVDEEFVLHGEFQTDQDWLNALTEVRCARMLSGFHTWCREVAGVELTG
jgi:hypothetical protein